MTAFVSFVEFPGWQWECGRTVRCRDSKHLDDAVSAVNRSPTLIDGLLSLARDNERTEHESVELAEACRDCWQPIETAEASLAVESDRTIRAKPNRLKQLLENLFGNAVDHGAEDVTITIGELRDGFYVADDGPGIPPDKHEQVLEAGYSTWAGRTGLGFSIVGAVAEEHGWEVSVSERLTPRSQCDRAGWGSLIRASNRPPDKQFSLRWL